MAKEKKVTEKPQKKVTKKQSAATNSGDDGLVGGRPDDRNPPKKEA
jgi:hypothetical protein